MKPNKEEVRKKFENLPESLQDIILSVEKVNTIKEIAHKYNLHIDQMGNLADEINYIILGFTKPYELIDNVKKTVGAPYDIAKEIVREVDEKILKPIRSELQELYNPENQMTTDKTAANQPIGSAKSSAPATKAESIGPAAEEPEKSVFDRRIAGLTASKKEQVNIDLDALDKPASQPINKPTTTDKEPPRHDPYREPTE